jgi:serine phosphatase RsbU (regulator of sigma subunit)/CheY-like chemotaxis protein
MLNAEGKKILLVVDDAPANIQVAQSILKDEYKIRVATSGAKALELVKVEPVPDLVLLDVMMPEIDGYEVCRRLKAEDATRDIPVIFLTGKTDAEDEAKGLEVGAVDYIRKPFSPAIVKARVRTHLMLRDARGELARQLFAIQHELELAREIQLSILPRQLPKMDGLEIAARYLPMSTVAGDFYQFLVVDEKHIGMLVADVSGHGPAAALIASMLRIALAAQLPCASEPAKVLWGLNQALCGKLGHNFVTAVYVFVDIEKEILSYAGAGHPPLLLWNRSSGSTREIEENGLFLGQFPGETYTAVEIPLEAGDRSVLYTDGIPECRNPLEEEFGTSRFMRFMEENHGLGVNEFADALLGRLSSWSEQPQGQGQRDDMTLVAFHYKNH